MIFPISYIHATTHGTWLWHFPIVHNHNFSHRKSIPQFHILYDILRFIKPWYFTFYIAKIFYIVMIFPLSHSCVSHIPMIVFIWHSYDARRYKLIEIGIRPSISKSQQPATFQCPGINTLRPRQNGRHFQMHFLEWKCVNFAEELTEGSS